MRPLKHRRRAYTLIEIMLVVVTIALLTLLAIPTIKRVREKSERAIITNALRQLYEAKEHYFTATGSPNLYYTDLIDKGYCSQSLKAVLLHPPGDWTFASLLSPNSPTSARHRISWANTSGTSSDRVDVILEYPPRNK